MVNDCIPYGGGREATKKQKQEQCYGTHGIELLLWRSFLKQGDAERTATMEGAMGYLRHLGLQISLIVNSYGKTDT